MKRWTLLVPLLLLAGCGGEDEIRVYWVPKQAAHDHAPQASGHPQGGGDTRPSPEDASWTLPDGWTVDPEPRAMRYVTLMAGDLEVAMTQFPGSVGSLLQNVDRWRGQLGLPPAPPHELQDAVEAVEHPEAEASVVDLSNPETDQRLWVALLRRPRVTWFVKAQGTIEQVSAIDDALRAFVASLRFKAGAPTRAASQPAARPAWAVPAGWTESPAEPPRLASYQIEGGGEATVSSFSGQVGELQGNVDRWRGQLGLPPLEDLALLSPQPAKIQLGDAEGTLVELHSDTEGMLVAYASHGSQTWFFKLKGPLELVERESARFRGWAESVDFHPPAPPADPHAGHDHGDAPPQGAAPFAFTAPEGWSQGEASPPRLLTLRTPSGAELSVTHFPGQVGTLETNLDRWRGQLGLPAGGDAAPETVVVSGSEGQLIELVGAQQAMRVASVSSKGQTWFFKLMGPAAAVADSRDGFAAFLASVELP